MVDHAITALGLPSVWALVHESTVPTRNLVRRLGFHDVGADLHDGANHRVLVATPPAPGRWRHVEVWVPDLVRAEESFGRLSANSGGGNTSGGGTASAGHPAPAISWSSSPRH